MKFSSVFLLILTLTLSSCSISNVNKSDNKSGSMSNYSIADVVTSATMNRYQEGELKEYNGTLLDPAVGPRDNSIKGIQNVNISDYTLRIDGLVESPQEYKYEDITSMPSVTRLLTLYCVEGWDATVLWKGVLMKDVLGSSKVKSEAKTIIFHAVDGYTTSLPLKEILDKNLIMAYSANNLPLPPALGFPFIFVAENKWGYKWARWINRIELSSDTNYKGYWEKLGYDNDAEYSK
jgi:DMSO/TMAO reductase YedYZ molybdopterin-dependent catalytic subunit